MINQLNFFRRFSNDYSRLGDDYACVHIHTENAHIEDTADLLPMSRFGGVLMVLSRKGDIELTVNMERSHLLGNTLMVIPPDTTICFHSINSSEIDMYVMHISGNFLRDINFEINMLNIVPLQVGHRPSMSLTEDECDLLSRYIELIHRNTLINSAPETEMYVRSISRNLMAAILYQSIALGRKHNTAEKPPETERQRSRKLIYTHEFMHLVRENFRNERSVGFYAEKLFISPKYLSLVIKESTGRSAANWIDEFVLTEAKHLLRFSGKNIQQVAYELNFTNQSSFGKYFKHLTGMSPSEYQHS
ncbi:MAG: AraC family transcriptional regulator [Muribaculaceae bacterium]|nr:AraC family transcriptional regulator [Muribaculaceae bacterium]